MRKSKRIQVQELSDRYRRCAGIDVHKQRLSVCVIGAGEPEAAEAEVREFGTVTQELLRLSQWLRDSGVEMVAMESTGVYWKPVYQVLESEGVPALLANARSVKNVPGKKTDTADCVWLATLLRKGLVRASLVPPAPVRALRDLCRSRRSLVRDRTRVAQRIEKVLEEGNIKLTSVASEVMGVSAQAMMRRLADGDPDPAELAELALGRLRGKLPELRLALAGRLLEHQRFLLGELLEQYEYLSGKIARFEKEIEARLAPFEQATGLVAEMPGFDRLSAATLLAELGFDMKPFPTAEDLCSWAAVCPGNRVTAGKRLSGKTRPGNRWLRSALMQNACAATRRKDSYYAALYQRLRRRMDGKCAMMAVGHAQLGAIWHMVTRNERHRDLGADYFDRLHHEQLKKAALKNLARLGYQVTLQPAA